MESERHGYKKMVFPNHYIRLSQGNNEFSKKRNENEKHTHLASLITSESIGNGLLLSHAQDGHIKTWNKPSSAQTWDTNVQNKGAGAASNHHVHGIRVWKKKHTSAKSPMYQQSKCVLLKKYFSTKEMENASLNKTKNGSFFLSMGKKTLEKTQPFIGMDFRDFPMS